MDIKKECITTQYNMGHDALSQPFDCQSTTANPNICTLCLSWCAHHQNSGTNAMANGCSIAEIYVVSQPTQPYTSALPLCCKAARYLKNNSIGYIRSAFIYIYNIKTI